MAWARILAKMANGQKHQKLDWVCSRYNRTFAKKESVMCHVLRNEKCSGLKATEVWLGRKLPVIERVQVKFEDEMDYDLEMEDKQRLPPIVQRPAGRPKKRVGVRPFPPALIARVAAEGKKLSKDFGRRETSRILRQRYATANLSLTSIDRWVFVMSDEKLGAYIALARQKGAKIRLPANLMEMSKSRISRPDLESEVYVRYRHRRDNLKLRISYS